MKTICFTGHRPKKLCGYNRDSYVLLVHQLKNILADYYKQGYTKFISGGAQGFDQLAFWAVNKLKNDGNFDIKNVVYIPFYTYGDNWFDTGVFGRNNYNKMLKIADEQVILDSKPTSKNEVIKCLMGRNHKMVDDSDLIIALYESDNYMNDNGGTAECIRCALKQKKPVLLLKYKIENNQICITKTKRI